MPKQKNKERVSLSERLSKALDISPDVFPSTPLIELRGKNSLTVSGAGGVTLYTDSEIRFALHNGELCICGKRLCCTSYHRYSATVDGLIYSVSFKGGEQQ